MADNKITPHMYALPAGTLLHEFRIDAVLGHGGFGITYRALDTALRKAVAIKEYLPNDLASRVSDSTVRARSADDQQQFEKGVAAFLDEARLVARLRHRNIMEVLRFFEANGTGYIVLGYEEGRTLKQRLDEGPLAEAELRHVLGGLLDGIEVLHNEAILHRDIKPSNIILSDSRVPGERGVPVLIDFGAARDFRSRHSRSVTTIVAPGYAPPEQYGIGGQAGPWSDLYALGATAYRCVTGQAPPEALRRLRKDPYVPAVEAAAGHYDENLLHLIDRMLAVDEADRPQSAGEVREALNSRGVLRSPPEFLRERRPIASNDATAPPRRRRLPAILGALSAAAVIAMVAVGITLYATGTLPKLLGTTEVKTANAPAPTVVPPAPKAAKVETPPKVEPAKESAVAEQGKAAASLRDSRPKEQARFPDSAPDQSTNPGPGSNAPPALQQVHLIEEGPGTPQGKEYFGQVVWRSVQVSGGASGQRDIAIRGDIDVPDLKFKMSFLISRNHDSSLPASHLAELTFILPPDFSGGSVEKVPGILMKSNEQERGSPLAGVSVKVSDGFFLIGFSNVDADRKRNLQLLKERSWFDIPLVYANNNRAIISIPKNEAGDRAFNDVFAAWEQTPAKRTIVDAVAAGYEPVASVGSLVSSVVFSPDGRTLTAEYWSETIKLIKLWDVASGQELRTFVQNSDDNYSSVFFSPDGHILVAGFPGTGGKTRKPIKLWDVASGQELRTFVRPSDGIWGNAFSPDGRILAAGLNGEIESWGNIELWDVATGRKLRTLTEPGRDVFNSLAFSPDGRTLVSGSIGRDMVKFWDVASGRPLRMLAGHVTPIQDVIFSPDGRTLASSEVGDKPIKLWDVASGRQLRTLAGGGVAHVAFSPDGRILASAGADETVNDTVKSTLKLWDVASGRELRTLAKNHLGRNYPVAFSPDGRTLAWGLEDGTIILWSTTDGSIQARYVGMGKLGSITFDGKGLPISVSGNEDAVYHFVKDGKTIKPSEMRAMGYDLPAPSRN